MNIAICDDNEILVDKLFKRVSKLFDIYNIYNFSFNFYTFTNANALLKKSKEIVFDVVFLDIEMPVNGFSVADELYLQNSDVIIIYVTNYDKFVNKSIKHRVYRFIVKGDSLELQDCIKNLINDFATQKRRYKFEFKNICYSIPFSEILYFESDKNNVDVVTQNETFKQRITIKHLVDILPNTFCRCHSAFIVNTKKIKKFEYNSITLYNDVVLPLSKKYRIDVALAMTNL